MKEEEGEQGATKGRDAWEEEDAAAAKVSPRAAKISAATWPRGLIDGASRGSVAYI